MLVQGAVKVGVFGLYARNEARLTHTGKFGFLSDNPLFSVIILSSNYGIVTA